MGRGRDRLKQKQAEKPKEGRRQQAEVRPPKQQRKAKKPKIGAGNLKAFAVQGVGELAQLTQAFPGDIKPVEVANTIWGQNPTPRDAYEAKHGVTEPKVKAAEKQQQAEAKPKAKQKDKQIEPGD